MGNTTRNTDEKRKAYKKAKKQRRKLRQAEVKESNNTRTEDPSTSKKKWRRVTAEDGAKKAVDRPLEAGYGVDAINDLLKRRSIAKAEKNYGVSDEITKTLVRLQIVYDDERWEWHTRAWKHPKGM
eukprot:CAMPEP_0201718504 /NCGR_PEP_ID=MMETSP0593-20130828/4002_1 /ASSEMBLY_ACC=CAM_ASM_000672 /TAXON_ID=267983 /ORGANISM="Skeletonema japonicum, Strain CCMP2506" /LENGTH=125 /DNA_ID=CAMNT_0048208815 /DNA_START=135 /DNA_END=512 /DNA_ORIENTATION=-